MRILAAALAVALLAIPPAAADAESAQRQYRIARRLAAEGSSDAARALRKVVELDPRGQLADDALLDEALLDPLPRWPEALGSIDAAAAGRALSLLGRILDEYPDADRTSEARFYRGLLLLEPLPHHDASTARIDLLTVATTPEAGEWAGAARYNVAWLAEQQARPARALAAYQRLWIDAPGGATSSRARMGLARLYLRDRRWARAASLLDAVARLQPAERATVDPLKELAVRNLLGLSPSRGALQVIEAATGVRALVGFACGPGGGVVTADRRTGAIVARDGRGRVLARWNLEQPQVVATSATGRILAATTEEIYVLRPDAPPTRVASLAGFDEPTDMTVDGLGGIWVLDRRGASIGRIEPGAEAPVAFWESRGGRLESLKWDGRRLIGVDARSKAVVVIARDGSSLEVLTEALQKPVSVAVDPSGRMAVLDVKAGEVAFFDSLGQPLDVFSFRTAGMGRASAIALGNDGTLHLFDESSAAWSMLR